MMILIFITIISIALYAAFITYLGKGMDYLITRLPLKHREFGNNVAAYIIVAIFFLTGAALIYYLPKIF